MKRENTTSKPVNTAVVATDVRQKFYKRRSVRLAGLAILSLVILGGAVYAGIKLFSKPAKQQVNVTNDPSTRPASDSLKNIDVSKLTPEQKYLHYIELAHAYESEKKPELALSAFIDADKQTTKAELSIIKSILALAKELKKSDIVNTYTQKLGTVVVSGDANSPSDLLFQAEIAEAKGDKTKAIELYQKFLSTAMFADLSEPDGKSFALSVKADVETKVKELSK